MLDMGFDDQIRDIVKKLPKDRPALLFSATFPEAIRSLGNAMLRDAVEVSVGGGSEPATIEQMFFEAEPDRTAPLLAVLLMHHQPESCLVFCNTRRAVAELVASLAHYAVNALALHSTMEQRYRAEVLSRFSNHRCHVLDGSDVDK